MHKKIAFLSAGLLLVASPLFVSAQTTSSSGNSLIATLTALVQKLEQELQQLIAGHSSTPTQQTTVVATSTSSTSFANLCAAYASLKKGDTDATTNGEVTQLQQFLGISPTTGYYGAQTSIAYQNKCGNLGNSQPTSVPGMMEYTSSDFSFWRPSSWTVSQITITNPYQYIGGTISQELQVNSGDGLIEIAEVHAPVLIDDSSGGADPVGFWLKYYFDTSTATWMRATRFASSGEPDATTTADVSVNTMGGLHMLPGSQRFGSDTIIPLSANTFLVVSSVNAGGLDQKALADTIVATNPAVAIPISTAQQTATIEAEAASYGVSGAVQSTNNDSASSGTSYSADSLELTYPSDFTLAQNITAAQQDQTISYMSQGCGENPVCVYYTGPGIDAVESAYFTLQSNAGTTYEECTNTTTEPDTSTVTINGTAWYKNSTGDAGLGHRISTDSYRTYYNGACYEADLSVSWNVGSDTGPNQTQFSALQDQLTSIMNSVQFTVPQTVAAQHSVPSTTPAWSTYNGSLVPISFSYPGVLQVSSMSSAGSLQLIQPNQTVGLQTLSGENLPGEIWIMTRSDYSSLSAVQAYWKSLATFTPITMGGEPALQESESDASVYYVSHNGIVYQIDIDNPIPSETQNFLNSFMFTN